ncbi:MAG: prephenate dehydrogenase/arogenate dehydrogenase family protein, partial [Eggerthellaceae bacterium]
MACRIMNVRFKSIVVIGLGMIGSSFAMAYRAAYPDSYIAGVDVSENTLKSAQERGWINEGYHVPAGLSDDDVEGMKKAKQELAGVINKAQLVLIATPVPVAHLYFKLIAECDYQGVVSDTCSTKALVSRQAQELLRYPAKYIPGHPMAGSEKSGIEGAKEDLFKGAQWVLCPDRSTSADDYADLHEMLAGIGARVVALDRATHDEVVAIVSHVPHFVASSLVELAVRHAGNQEALFRLAAGGFKDSTRIAAGSPALWCGIAFDNRKAIVEGLDEVRSILKDYADTLRENDRAAFTALLERAAKARRALPAKWVPATEDLLQVRIPLTNRPGIVAEITTIASKVGCNIQS